MHPVLQQVEEPRTLDTPESKAPVSSTLRGKRVGMVVFSSYPDDPRPRRAAEALVGEGMLLDLICESDNRYPNRETLDGMEIFRVPIKHHRGGKLGYVYQYCAFIAMSAGILGWRSLRHRYDLIHIHNMPDVLVGSALFPKALGAKVILDEHDPMPELMRTIFNLEEGSLAVRLIGWLERKSMSCADLVITVNEACKKIFSERSCSPTKIGIVMNSPDEKIFSYRSARCYSVPTVRPDKRFAIMYHGSIVERNGLDVAVRALAEVRPRIPKIELRVYGKQTEFLNQVMEQARALGVEDCILYFGPKRLEELVHEIEDCDAGVIPNKRSAFADINTPTRIFEYLAIGKPVIAPRTSGILDYFSEESLLLFEAGNATDLAKELEYAYCHGREMTEITVRGQQVYSPHTWREERKGFVRMVEELLKGGLKQ